MESFMERMINRAHRRSTHFEYISRHPNYTPEGKALQGQGDPGRINIQKSCGLVTKQISPFDYDSLPIRSPKNYKFNDSVLSCIDEINISEGAPKKNISSVENQDNVMAKLHSEEAGLKDFDGSAGEKKCSNFGAKFISHLNLAVTSESKSGTEHLKNNLCQMSDNSTNSDKFRMKQNDFQLKQLSKVEGERKQHDFSSINSDTHRNKEADLHTLEFCSISSNSKLTSKMDEKTVQKAEKNTEKFISNFNDSNDYHIMKEKVQEHCDSNSSVRLDTGISECTFNHEYKDSEWKSRQSAESQSRTPNNATMWWNHSGIAASDTIVRIKLEKIDDKEERLSQLDEINVSAMKLEELTLPGLKLAHMVTEKLPIYVSQNLPQSLGFENHSYSCSTQSISKMAKKNQDAVGMKTGRKQLRHSLGKETSEKYNEKCKSNGNTHSNGKNHATQEDNISNNWHSSKRNSSKLEGKIFTNRSDRGFEESISQGKYRSLSDSSLNLSMYSDISFICACSTPVSQSSVLDETPNDSLPYLLLHHLSLGKKMKMDSVKAKSLGMNGEKETTSICAENFDNMGHNDSDTAQTNSNYGESEIHKIYRKVAVETIIADQASKALQHCYSSSAFAGSAEQVECERLLLQSTMRKQALIGEMQCLKAQPSSNCGINQCVEVSVENIKLHLKDDFMDFLIASKQKDQFYFLCIIAYQDTVLCTEAVAAKRGQPTISFPAKNVKIESELLYDMCICLRVYMLQVKQNKFEKTKRKQQKKSSEVTQSKHAISKHDSSCLLLCGSKESEKNSKFLKNACEQLQTRVPGFILIGRGEMYLPNDINENFCILQQYEDCITEGEIPQPLHETVQFEISCAFPSKSLDILMNKTSVQYQGFLTQFSMIGGIAAWQRGWWCLKGTYLMCWKYPEDQEIFHPLLIFDLKHCTEKISPVSRLKCARSNTFSIKMKPEGHFYVKGKDASQFSLSVSTQETCVEHILSADTRGERDDWCTNLNGILMSLQSWKVKNLSHLT